jgi:hypothetical protein
MPLTSTPLTMVAVPGTVVVDVFLLLMEAGSVVMR